MPLPKTFGLNEIVLISSIIIGFLVILKLPKRFPLVITILLLIQPMFTARLFDHIIATAQIMEHNLYDTMDSGKFELFDLFTYPFYSPIGYMFVYIYDIFPIKGQWIAIYIVSWSLVSTLIEILLSKANIFVYLEWQPYYSFIVYLIVQSLTIAFYNFIIKEYKSIESKLAN